MMYYCVGINTIITISRSVSQLGTLFASGASFWCYININELYIKKRLLASVSIKIVRYSKTYSSQNALN